MRFLSAADLVKALPVSVGIGGGSGTGKTYSALRLARGIASELAGPGAPFAFCDTENRRALHYRDAFPEMLEHYLDFGPEEDGKLIGYPPRRWSEMLDFVEASDAKALVVDSASHAWEGISGVLDLQSEIHSKMGGGEKDSLRAWAKVKPDYRKYFVNRMIQCSVPTIVCTRAKPVIPDPKNPGKNLMPTKTRRDDVPWDLAADRDLLFEMTVQVILDPKHPGCPLYQIKMPDQFKALFPPDVPLSEETGRALARWTRDQSSAAESKALMDEARAKAREGGEAMRVYWSKLRHDQQATLLPIRDELRETAARVDTTPAVDQASFFDKPAETVADAGSGPIAPLEPGPERTGDASAGLEAFAGANEMEDFK